jgi:hypothetical protein
MHKKKRQTHWEACRFAAACLIRNALRQTSGRIILPDAPPPEAVFPACVFDKISFHNVSIYRNT